MLEVNFYEYIPDELLKFAVIIARTKGKWIFCKHMDRETYEIPGGHREKGESIEAAAERELREETGAIDFTIRPVCVYGVRGQTRVSGASEGETFGMLFTAEVETLADELHSEIEKILITDELVDYWAYPLIQPKLIEEAKRRNCIDFSLGQRSSKKTEKIEK